MGVDALEQVAQDHQECPVNTLKQVIHQTALRFIVIQRSLL